MVCILSGRYPASPYDSPANHKIYADIFGYNYIHCNWPSPSENRYLNKVRYVLQYFDLFDYIIWIDDDAFFYDFEKDIMDYAPKGDKFISLCKSPDFKELKTYLSSGQFIVKTNDIARDLFEKMLVLSHDTVKEWWTPEMGYYTNGDQDLLIYLLLNDPTFKDGFDLHNYKSFNSRIENLFGTDPHDPLILHFTGKPEIKWEHYQKVQVKFSLHSSLAPITLARKYFLASNRPFRKKKGLRTTLRKWLKG